MVYESTVYEILKEQSTSITSGRVNTKVFELQPLERFRNECAHGMAAVCLFLQCNVYKYLFYQHILSINIYIYIYIVV